MLAGWITEHGDRLHTHRRLEARAAGGGLLTGDDLPEFLRWVAWTATPAGQLLGASDAIRTLVRRSVAARRFRRAGLALGLVAITAVAIVFAVQAQRLREEQAKTREEQAKTGQSIHTAMKTADAIAFEFDENLSTVACAGASVTRGHLQERLRELVTELSVLGTLSEDDQRTTMAGKAAEAQLALERGHLDQASALYLEALADAHRRAAADPSNAGWQRDLSVSYNKLGDVAVTAGKLDDARGWFEKAQALAAADPSNAGWQRDLCTTLAKFALVARTPTETMRNLDEARTVYNRLQRDGLFQGDAQFTQIGKTLDALRGGSTSSMRAHVPARTPTPGELP